MMDKLERVEKRMQTLDTSLSEMMGQVCVYVRVREGVESVRAVYFRLISPFCCASFFLHFSYSASISLLADLAAHPGCVHQKRKTGSRDQIAYDFYKNANSRETESKEGQESRG